VACKHNSFYVDATLCFNDTYSIGSMTTPSGECHPSLYSTLTEALSDNLEMTENMQQQIDSKERDDDDTYQGRVMKASITGDNEVSLYDLIKGELIWVGEIDMAMGF